MRAYFRPLARVLVAGHDRARRARPGQGAAGPTDLVLVAVVLAGFVGLVTNGLIDTVQRTLLPWHRKGARYEPGGR